MLLNYYYLLVKFYEFPTNIYRYFEKVGSINKKSNFLLLFFVVVPTGIEPVCQD